MGTAFTDLRRTSWRLIGSVLLFALLLSVVSLSLVAQTTQQTNQVRLVSTAWPPFTNETGQPRFALDLIEAALGRTNVAASTTIVDAGKFTAALLNGPFDGSGAAWKDADRERVLLFSQPYLENRLILVGRKGTDVSATTLKALAGKRIAIVEGYAYGDAVDKAGPVFVRTRSEEDSLTQLLTSAVDYTLMDDLVVQHLTRNYATEAQARLQFGTAPLAVRPLYLAVRRSRPDAQSLITRFNEQLRSLIADGTYHRLLQVDWIQADVDGDGVSEYVPSGERSGTLEPRSAYSLVSSTGQPAPSPTLQSPSQRFYVGGQLYDGWGAIPDRYKVDRVDDIREGNPTRSGGTIFKFTF